MTAVARVSAALCVLALSACAVEIPFANEPVLGSDQSAAQLRSYQSRVFDTADKERTLRAVMATLQDLGFVIDKADATLGSVSATKLARYHLRMSVTVRPKGDTQMIVRANAEYQQSAVETPKFYQDFFAALQKSMFLAAQNLE